jgi:DNA-binding SARP family transcriptional activator/tetratricopeptide (TPR) repeat protein
LNLEIRLLGGLEVRRDGAVAELPPSRKSRALLAYLVATGRAHSRSHLCDLLFDGPDDPRAALRWSLTKLRGLVDAPGAVRLVADRERVAFEEHGAVLDWPQLRRDLGGGVAAVSTPCLEHWAGVAGGELLEGLDLPDCHRYHEWWAAEREASRKLLGSALEALAERLSAERPEVALGYARGRLALEPHAEAGHAAVIRLLARQGRGREALEQYERCRRVLESELGARPSPELERMRRELAPPGPRSEASQPPAHPPSGPALVGRAQELRVVDAALAGRETRVLAFLGEPGIGKTRPLEELARAASARGARVLRGRAFEAEGLRPYGAWIDALRSAPLGPSAEAFREELAGLLPELGRSDRGLSDRSRLFDAVRGLVSTLAEEGRVVLLIDDVQWCDEASAALLHYLGRSLAGQPVVMACAARPGELAANPHAQRALRNLERDGQLATLRIPPLAPEETEALARALGADPRRVLEESHGNPLFAIEVAGALARGSALSSGLAGLIQERLERLDPGARELVPWAVCLGRSFSLDDLARVIGRPAPELLGPVEALERHSVLRVAATALGRPGYDFNHDLLRRTAYQAIPEPSRAAIHAHIARAFHALPDPDGVRAGDVAHHAALGGDLELAARACVVAGGRCLRVFAYAEAASLAHQGTAFARQLSREVRVPLQLELLEVEVHSRAGKERTGELEELRRLIGEAQELGLLAHVRMGFYLGSFIHYHGGEHALAHAATLHAEEAGRSADPSTEARALANTGRCLVLLQRDLPKAEAMLREARDRATAGAALLDVHWGLGLVRHFLGDHDAARSELLKALALARREADHWAECDCLARLALIAFEESQPEAALQRCLEMGAVATRMGEASEGPFAAGLLAVARLALGEPDAEAALAEATRRLRELDSRWMTACVLVLAAELDAAAGRRESARERALEALAVAQGVGRRSEAARAAALLVHLDLADREPERAAERLSGPLRDLAEPWALSARARAAVAEAVRCVTPGPNPTPPQTPPTTPRL